MLGRKKDGKEKKPKKEKKPRKEKEKKPKKVKPKKAPKPKKEKKPKPKKQKPPKKSNAKANGQEAEGGKKSKLKLLLIIIPLVLAVSAAGVFVVLPKVRGKADAPEETEQTEETEEPEEEAQEEPEEGESPDPGIDEEGVEPLTVSQAVNYMMTLPPSLLGLEGASMNEYDIYPGGAVVSVDGMACTELSVYMKSDAAGTNDIKGTFLLSRGSMRRLFKLNRLTKEVTEIALPSTGEEAGGEEDQPENGEA